MEKLEIKYYYKVMILRAISVRVYINKKNKTKRERDKGTHKER